MRNFMLAAALLLPLACEAPASDEGETETETETGDGDGDGTPVSLPGDFVDQLTSVTSCRDIFVAAVNPERTLMLTIWTPALSQQAHDQGESIMAQVELPSLDNAYRLRIQRGTELGEVCTDVVSLDPVVDAEWIAISGTVSVTVEPGDTAPGGTAIIELSNVTFEGEGLEPALIESLTLTNLHVGWEDNG